MSFLIADEVRSTESAIISSYPTSVSGIIVFIKYQTLDKKISNFIFFRLEFSANLGGNFP